MSQFWRIKHAKVNFKYLQRSLFVFMRLNKEDLFYLFTLCFYFCNEQFRWKIVRFLSEFVQYIYLHKQFSQYYLAIQKPLFIILAQQKTMQKVLVVNFIFCIIDIIKHIRENTKFSYKNIFVICIKLQIRNGIVYHKKWVVFCCIYRSTTLRESYAYKRKKQNVILETQHKINNNIK